MQSTITKVQIQFGFLQYIYKRNAAADAALSAPVRATELQKENSRDPHLTSSRLCGLGCRLSPFRTRFLKALSLV